MAGENDSTHTIRYEQPSVWSTVPLNKAAQFVLGLVLILVGFKLWWAGWFSAFAQHNGLNLCPAAVDGEPMQSTGLLVILFDTVCLVGIVGFAVVGFVWRSVGPLAGGFAEYWAKATAWATARVAGTAASVASSTISAGRAVVPASIVARMPDGTTFTQKQLNALFSDRLKTLELKTRDLPLPEPPPAPKTDAERIAELEAVIAELKAVKPARNKASTTKAVQS